ncbi:Metallo-dependent hydrolase [Meredithblackwellia eburnea MCA 4105]
MVSDNILDGFPFLDVHSHLNGSIPQNALQELIRLKLKEPGNEDLATFSLPTSPEQLANFNIDDFFPLFSRFVYRLTSTASSITFATKAVLLSFAHSGCCYLELRTTPRAVPSTNMSLSDYVKAVRLGFDEFFQTEEAEKMKAFLILSCDRRHDLSTVEKVVDLAIGNKGLVVGIDVCGDPNVVPDVREWVPAFKRAKKNGLGVTVHLGELEGQLSTQAMDLLLEPDRLGHATFLTPETQEYVIKHRIPIEICLTSNLICKTVANLEDHHLNWALESDVPVFICTDDTLVFLSPPKTEYELALSLVVRRAPAGLGGESVEDSASERRTDESD